MKTQVGGCPARIVSEVRHDMLAWYLHPLILQVMLTQLAIYFSKYLAE